MTKSDYRILEALEDSEILEVQSPAIIAFNLDITREHVSNRLSNMVEKDLVERIEEGKYRITDRGKKFIQGSLDSSELED